MRAIYLIARREYLSYVATWGFWLSLLSVPLFMVLGAGIPFLVESSQPTRYYAIVDTTGENYDRIVQEGLEAERRERVRAALEAIGPVVAGQDRLERALAAFDHAQSLMEGLDEALATLGIEQSAQEFAAGFGDRVRVEAPGADPDQLRPWLTGARTLSTPEGERALFGALFITPGEDEPLALTWYSTHVTSNEIATDARRILERHMRRQALAEGGLSESEIERISRLSPELRNLDPAARPGADAEITGADKAPFFLSILLAFILWTSVFSVANMLLTSLIEEKGGKIIEVLLSTARFHEILIGKLAGVAGVSFTLFAIWGLVGTLVAVAGGGALAALDPEIAQILSGIAEPGLFAAALCYFVVGYLMFGAIFLALGSLCETLQDAQTLMTPLILLLMAPLLILVFSLRAMDSVFVQVASWVPLWTPFVMMARLPTEPPLWEIAATTGLMLATMAAILWAAAAVFRQGALGGADVDTVKRWFRFAKKG